MRSIQSMSAAEFNALPVIDDVTPLNEDDYACMEDIRNILQRYGKIDRFGIMLLHRHFELQPGEMLVEYTDVGKRMQTVEVGSGVDMRPCAVETAWALKAGASLAVCYPGVCVYTGNGHYRGHVTS